MMRNRRLPLLGAICAVAVVVVALVVISSRGSASSQSVASDAGSTTENLRDTTGVEPSTPSTSLGTAATQPTGPFTTPNMPLSVAVGSTTALKSGDTVSVTVSPKDGAQAYGAEARLCRGDALVQFDGDLFPTRAGLCIPKPFTEGTNEYLEVRNLPPYGPLTVRFKVGTGSQTFKLQDGSQSTITCDATHPCQLVLKLQYPNGFGFQGVPLTFE